MKKKKFVQRSEQNNVYKEDEVKEKSVYLFILNSFLCFVWSTLKENKHLSFHIKTGYRFAALQGKLWALCLYCVLWSESMGWCIIHCGHILATYYTLYCQHARLNIIQVYRLCVTQRGLPINWAHLRIILVGVFL